MTIKAYRGDRFSLRATEWLSNTRVGKKMALLGGAFKANTSDTRESPALEIVQALLQEGLEEVAVVDPCCSPAVVREEMRTLSRG